MSDRLRVLKTVLWTLVGVLAAVTVVRFTRGLGAVTNLSDAAPWGLWIGFDVMSGVALAAGGFVLAATVYVFGLERYRPFVRPAILTAWLGYAAVAVGLLYDLGLPWRIWHPMVNWQVHSVLFEVAACVMLYLTVLTLEFAPAILEHRFFSARPFKLVLKALKRLTIVLVIAGIVLSTLHQSSLGSLFLITPYRLHPLWYSPIIYVLFFVSAVGLGLMMVVMESLLSSWFLGHRVHVREVGGLGLAASVVLWLYVALRLGDLAARGGLAGAFDGSWQANLFLAELALSAVVPAALLLSRRIRSTLVGVGTAATMVVSGMVLYRLDVSIIAFARPEGFGYVPSWEEVAVSVGIVSAFALVFIFFVERLAVYDDVGGGAAREAAATADAAAIPPRPRPPRSYDPRTLDHLLPARLWAPARYSLAVLAGVTLALPFLPLGGVERAVPVAPARRVQGLVRDTVAPGARLALRVDPARGPASRATPGTPRLFLLVDGNRDGEAVLFDHEEHERRFGDDASCVLCHHLTLPLDRGTPCASCHRDMYDSTSTFSHEVHAEALGGNDGCAECHADPDAVKTMATATPCAECHDTPVAIDPALPAPEARWRPAAGYMDAMHGLCVGCHERAVAEEPGEHPADLATCRACHDPDRSELLRRLEPTRRDPGTVRSTVVAGGSSSP